MKEKRVRRRFSRQQKRQFADQTRRLRSKGWSFGEITKKLDVNEGSLRLWMKQFPTESEFQAVEVVAGPASLPGITVRAPDGYVFEGLDVDGAAILRGMLD